ncbi:MAG: PilZ domain-containing protein [Candidatus Sulfobium sp.]
MKIKRHYRRFMRRLEVEFSANDRHYRGISSNFSLGGMFVRTNHAFATGTLIDITVHLPGGGTAALKGRVKMALKTPAVSLRNGMGVEIVESDPVFVDFIKSLSNDSPLTKEKDSETVSPNEDGQARPTVPDSRDFSIIICSFCGIRNRVRRSGILKALRCGKCGASFTPPA